MNKSMPAVGRLGDARRHRRWSRWAPASTTAGGGWPSGVANRPMSLLWIRVVAWVVVGGFMVFLLNQNRGQRLIPIAGRADRRADRAGHPVDRHGRARPHAVRPAHLRGRRQPRGRAARRHQGARVRIAAFIICSTLAVVVGAVHRQPDRRRRRPPPAGTSCCAASAPPSSAASACSAVAAGSCRPPIGALLISMITNGLGLLGYSAGITFLVTGGVLILAATIDALSRRRSGSSSLAR